MTSRFEFFSRHSSCQLLPKRNYCEEHRPKQSFRRPLRFGGGGGGSKWGQATDVLFSGSQGRRQKSAEFISRQLETIQGIKQTTLFAEYN